MLNALLWNLLLTAGLALVLATFCRLPSLQRRPALIHWLWLLLLVKLVTPPVIPVPLLPAVDGEEPVAVAPVSNSPTVYEEPIAEEMAAPSILPELVSELDRTPVVEPPAVSLAAGDPVSFSNERAVSGQEPAVTAGEPRVVRPFPITVALLAVSLIGTCLLFIVHAVRAARFNRWLKRAAVDDSFLTETCAGLASTMGVPGKLESRVVDTRITPLLWGWRRPMVVVPRQLVDELQPNQLRSILAHELAHLVRRDHWANLFVCVVKALLWWNPVVWWANRELRVAQEMCCDAMAIDRCQARRSAYAATLLKTLDFIQPPVATSQLALGMGSRGTILRRFEMIGERELSYRMSRWAIFGLFVLGTALVCMPVRGHEDETGLAAATHAESNDQAEAANSETGSVDPETRELGEAVRSRLNDYSDIETLTLRDGETGRMRIKKNITPVAEIRITPRFEADGTTFDIQGVDAEEKWVTGVQASARGVRDNVVFKRSRVLLPLVDGRHRVFKFQLAPSRQDDSRVVVETKVLFVFYPTEEELSAMRSIWTEPGPSRSNMETIRRLVLEFEDNWGHFPEKLADLKTSLPKDVHSRKGEDYRYEALGRRFVVSGCGKDGVYGNDDDEINIVSRRGDRFGLRRDMYPLQEDSWILEQSEWSYGERPRGNCSIGGRVVSAETRLPVSHARVSLYHAPAMESIRVDVAADGTFLFKDVPRGPFWLYVTHTAGYRDRNYNPDAVDSSVPKFTLNEGEQRLDLELKLEPACRISGKILDARGAVPENIKDLSVQACFKKEGRYKVRWGSVDSADGSYTIDGLEYLPAYVLVTNGRAAKEGRHFPAVYHPSTFSRKKAKQILFHEGRVVEDVDITLRTEGGLAIEGIVVDEEGKAVPETLVLAHPSDMYAGYQTTYTDESGRYRIDGLGDGEFLVHADATHRGYVRMRHRVKLERLEQATCDFVLPEGVLITGKFVDQEGNDWQIGASHGTVTTRYPSKPDFSFSRAIKNSWPVNVANYIRDPKKYARTAEKKSPEWGFSPHFRNKYGPESVGEYPSVTFWTGEGPYDKGTMIFPTKSTFAIHGMTPGYTRFSFFPREKGQEVLEIRCKGENLRDGSSALGSGFDTLPGEKIEDVVFVIGEKKSE